MKIFYWSPFISKVATVSSVIRSAESILKYSKSKENINVAIIDAIGEWTNYRKIIDQKINKQMSYKFRFIVLENA